MSVANDVVPLARDVFFSASQHSLTHSLLHGGSSPSRLGVQRPTPMMYIWNEGGYTGVATLFGLQKVKVNGTFLIFLFLLGR
jgi:hypothetical protein